MGKKGREKEKERERKREREKGRRREKEKRRGKEKGRETERRKKRERERKMDNKRDRERKRETETEREMERKGLWRDCYAVWRGREASYCLLGEGLLGKEVIFTLKFSLNKVASAEPPARPRPVKLAHTIHKISSQMWSLRASFHHITRQS